MQQAAKRRGAAPVDSETFLRELDRREAISPLKEAETPASRSSQSIAGKPTVHEDWQSVFGEIDVEALTEEVRREPLGPMSAADAESSEWETLQRQLEDPDWLERWLKE